jgi:L-aspartate oxidase
MRITCDFLVLGSGVAGLTFALEAAKHGEVVVVTKRGLSDSNTNWAQGGIAAVLDPSDSFEAHAKDTLTVGYGLSKPSVVDLVVKGGPAGIKKLIELGASFDEKDDKAPSAVLDGHALDYSSIDFSRFDLTREGGHSARRVIHAGDMTGREVQRALAEAARAHPNIRVLEHHMAVDLVELSKYGGPRGRRRVRARRRAAGKVPRLVARATVLATGGAGKVYLYTSNPDVATGDGVAMAYRAGAAHREHGVLPVPPDLPLPPAGQELPHQRGAARRGRHPAPRRRHAFMERHHARRTSRRATSWPAPSTSR